MNLKRLFASLLFLNALVPSYGAMHCNGNGIEVPTPGVPAGSSFTFCFWVYVNGGGGGFSTFFDSPVRSMALFVNNAAPGTITFSGSLSPTAGNTNIYTGSGWHHYLQVRDSGAGTLTAYVDGVSFYSGADVGNSPAFTLYLGENPSCCGSLYDYVIDDVRWYQRALTSQEITALATSRSRLLITDGLYGWWKLDEGTDGATAAGTVKDSSGNGNNGTIGGSPVWAASTWINYP